MYIHMYMGENDECFLVTVSSERGKIDARSIRKLDPQNWRELFISRIEKLIKNPI